MKIEYDDKTLKLIEDLKHNIYNDASNEHIKLAIDWCEARGVDVKLNLVAITSRNCKNKMTNQWEKKIVLIPTISYYRLRAHATGSYAGKSSPVYGPMITKKIGTKEVTYPEWCEITVRKIVKGIVCEFIDRQFWLSNYATVSKDDPTPTAMWAKRAPEQLAKCTEAQSLRMAFPELFGSDDTYEELEGKLNDFIEGSFHNVNKTNKIQSSQIDKETGEIIMRESIPDTIDDKWKVLNEFKQLCKTYPQRVSTWLEKAKVTKIEDFPIPAAIKLLERAKEIRVS